VIAEGTITRLLGELKQGSPEALDAIVRLIYDELLIVAHRQRLRWRGDYTLGTTALVHEAYLKLAGQDAVAAENRAHFFALASRAMRHILFNYARDRQALKRGGGFQPVGLAGAVQLPGTDSDLSDTNSERLLALGAALARLEQDHPRRSRVVECRFFGGMSVVDTAAALGISPRTVKRDWAFAQDWLREEISNAWPAAQPDADLEKLAADVLPAMIAALARETGDDLQPGQRVAQYEIGAPLGRGGMGVVYRAYDTRLDRQVALKFLSPYLAADPMGRARLTAEARAASALDHPNICTIYDIDALPDGRMFLALACYEGMTLKERIAGRPLPLGDAVGIARQIAEALAAAHRRGIVHRDIKPSNVMITTAGAVKILDFGIATVRDQDESAEAGAAGTVAYMSPEQTRGEEVDARTDLWSLGVVMHEMLAGRRPFEGEDRESLFDAIRTGPLPPLAALRADVPPLLVRLVETCLQKDRAARYRSADELCSDLGAIDAEPGARGASSRRIAVLPLDSGTSTSEGAYLADTITDELATRLSRLSGLHVIARASTLSVADGLGSPAEIGASLGVGTIVRGSVARSGGDVAITLQLFEVEQVEQVEPGWQVQQEVPLADLESALRSLTWQLAGELAVQVYDEERRQLARNSSGSGTAYELYLKGRYFWNKRDRASMQQARDYFQQALDHDPVFARAWAGLADTFSLLGSYALLQPEEAYPRARAAAEQALAIDEDLAEAHASLANVRADYDWDWTAAGRHYRRALALNPSYASARLWYAGFLRDLGQFDAALAQVRAARELDPLSLPIQAAEGTTLYVARRYADAVAVCRRLLQTDPSFSYANFLLALPLVQQGDYEGARRALEEAERRGIPIGGIRSLAGYIHAARGLPAEARRMLDELDAAADRPHALAFKRAVIHAALAEPDRALDSLEAGCDARVKDLRLLRIEPLLDPLRGEPRFQALLAKVGLADDDVARALAP
jgi:eukaryotic-like serine/threonine-protein kinase